MYGGELEVVEYIGEEGMAKFEEYGLFCVPAVIVGDLVRFMGLCPSWESLIGALRGVGL